MLIQKNKDLKDNEVTDFALYKSRRQFMKNAMGLGLIAATGSMIQPSFANASTGRFSTTEKATPYKDITSYCNFYEFGT
ncbi:MAG: mononuclear molybdenum enzyme YedY, partial [Cocleimonas sp.]|nr:mononuclear molybdenum enzyme YedY [Cocleimonas sp.]